jgi:hypothetical protein
MTDLAAKLIGVMERLDTRSAAVLRHASYRVLEELGIDVRRLVGDARAQLIAERRAAAERSQNSLDRLRERAARIPELQAVVMGGPADQVREMLASKAKPVEITIALDVPLGYVRAVRDLDRGREARLKLTAQRKAMPRKHWERLARIERRGGWSSAPTRERKRQLGEGEEFIEAKVAGEQKSHRTAWPVDQIRPILSDAAYFAAERLRDAYDGMQPGSRDASFDRYGTAGNPSNRLGLTPTQERSGRVWHAMWGRLPAGLRFVVQNFVLERPWGGEERALSFVEFGRRYGSADGDKQCRGVAQGALKAACDVLAHLSKEFDVWVQAEQRKVYKAMTAGDVAGYIRDAAVSGDDEGGGEGERTAVGLLCKRIKVEHWIIRRCVRRALRAAREAKGEEAQAASVR